MARTIAQIGSALKNFGSVNEENVEVFEDLVQEAFQTHDGKMLGPLLVCLDDSCDFDEVMFGLIHAVEAFGCADYFAVLAERLNPILSKSPRWGSILVTRIMNSQDAYSRFLAKLSEQDQATKNEAIALMRRLSAKERFQRQCEEGIRALSRA